MDIVDIKQIAYHEAGHCVIGYYFFSPVEQCSIVKRNNQLGHTICELPCPLIVGKFENRNNATSYFQIILFSWAGEYFQRKMCENIIEEGLLADKDLLTVYCDDKLIYSFDKYKIDLTNTFFDNEVLNSAVNDIAENLLNRSLLNGADIFEILSKYNFDYISHLEKAINKYYDCIKNEYQK